MELYEVYLQVAEQIFLVREGIFLSRRVHIQETRHQGLVHESGVAVIEIQPWRRKYRFFIFILVEDKVVAERQNRFFVLSSIYRIFGEKRKTFLTSQELNVLFFLLKEARHHGLFHFFCNDFASSKVIELKIHHYAGERVSDDRVVDTRIAIDYFSFLKEHSKVERRELNALLKPIVDHE